MNQDGKFSFQQFDIVQNNPALRFGTDSVLLGSWVVDKNYKQILDVGTGSGILSLMCAQRFIRAEIIAIDIDKSSIECANYNFQNSTFSNRLTAYRKDYLDFSSEIKFDLIISNPPYFKDSLLGEDDRRNKARHETSLSLEKLITKSVELLNKLGVLAIIIPFDRIIEFEALIFNSKLSINTKCIVKARSTKPFNRVLFECSYSNKKQETNELVIYKEGIIRSAEFSKMTSNFYL